MSRTTALLAAACTLAATVLTAGVPPSASANTRTVKLPAGGVAAPYDLTGMTIDNGNARIRVVLRVRNLRSEDGAWEIEMSYRKLARDMIVERVDGKTGIRIYRDVPNQVRWEKCPARGEVTFRPARDQIVFELPQHLCYGKSPMPPVWKFVAKTATYRGPVEDMSDEYRVSRG